MTLRKILSHRYATKSYDRTKRIPECVFAELLEALRLSPSSVNCQPWHFIVADDEKGKARIGKSTEAAFRSNHTKIMDSSHTIVLCARTALPETFLETVLEQEQEDGRFPTEESRLMTHKVRSGFVKLHQQYGSVSAWSQKQLYIALGFLLLSAGFLKIDATPIEGFDEDLLNEELGLKEKNLTACVIVTLGYRDACDVNATLPKSRLSEEVLISRA
ncbi:oxygen-insensitive NAD(P)H nitroreductase [Acetobacteraceae bacterium ESL0709]|nr:oxygen-insensitive NAD(P)H nitroreductase [Acetobacteraceae bacterium ESL0697]MDF7678442.1 oxygen-insensitive NAD(P)H nitroreductase [Acetobacteraceae bacterium ESL0709]